MILFFYRLLYPLICIFAAPFWIVKMIRRGGWGSGLLERIGRYDRPADEEKKGAVYLHAVSVGETLLALKLVAHWKRTRPDDHFVLVPTTATGMAVAKEKAPEDLRVIYAPLDLGFLLRRVMKRFAPRVVILIESELWPGLLTECEKRDIPVGIVNARLSPRSEKRLRKVRNIMAPFLRTLDHVGVPEAGDVERWAALGVRREALTVTGNLKFDPEGAIQPQRRSEFTEMLAAFGTERHIGMAISTFRGEEEFLAKAFLTAGLLPVIVPRHAERREEVKAVLEKELARPVILRSQISNSNFAPAQDADLAQAIFVIDSTGELRDWTAHADIVVIGKSFFSKGGQNPAEAIQAGVPVIAGPHMANFEPLVSELKEVKGITTVETQDELVNALSRLLHDPQAQVAAAQNALGKHQGAVCATITMFDRAKS